MDQRGEPVAAPKISMLGLCAPDSGMEAGLLEDIDGEIADTLLDIEDDRKYDETYVAEQIRRHVRRMINKLYGIKPQTQVHVFVV
jgi:mRNA degradation ribonuclease J1/J2